MPNYNNNNLPIDLQEKKTSPNKKHSALSFDNFEASQSKYMLLSALLTAHSRPDWIKYPGESTPLYEWGGLNSLTSKLPNRNITEDRDTSK